MTGLDPVVELLLAFVGGAAVALAVAALLYQRRLVRTAARLSAAEAHAAAQQAHREQLEAEAMQSRQALRDLDRQIAVSAERREQAERLLEEQRGFLERARGDLEDTFQALAGAALKGSSQQFLELADQRLATARAEATADLEERRQAIDTLIAPLTESLEKLARRTREIEGARLDAYSRLDQQLGQLAQATTDLESKTQTLATALTGSQVRGRWGEIALRNIAELAGMTPHCDFEEQLTLDDGGRPDMTVRLPGGRLIAVDAKAPLTAFLEATEADTKAARDDALARHVRDLRKHIRDIAGRDYATALEGEVDLVVMFLPGDPFLGAAFAKDPDLQVEALRSRVLVATPTTLVALLRTVAIYWQQQAMAENAEAIAATARQLYERAAKFGGDLGTVGRGLRTALDAYNRAVGSFERRLMPMGRRLEELAAAPHPKRRLEPQAPIADEPRPVAAALPDDETD